MSKKTQRLEKENSELRRKQEQVTKNIVDMAQDREKQNKDLELAKKREQKMKAIITQMQQQGRGIPNGLGGGADEDSEYDEEDDEDDPSDPEAVYGDDDGDLTEEEQHTGPQPFGPVPPPPVTANGQ